tara:strand:- start:1248 stop:3512 length:2265 start_codon:yes stop_codon:yes gene_type:complete
MIDLFQARRESHEARELGHEFKIQEGGVSLEVPRVEGQAFYPSGDAPRMTRDGTPMENIKEGLADLPKAVGSAGAGLAAGAAGLPGDLVSLIGGLGSALFPGDQSRLDAFTTTMTDISETIGSERFLGLYRDIVNNSDFSLEDKQMMLDTAEGASFLSIPGAGVVAKGGVDTIRSGVVKAGEAAQARLDEAAGSTTLAAGGDMEKAIDQALSYAGRKVRKSGQVVGAPPSINSQKTLDTLRVNLEAAAREGEPGRFWYERSGKAILDALGGDKEEAEKLVQAIAITSATTGVKPNFDHALRAYAQYKAGKPIKTGRFPAAMSKRVQAVFEGTDWEGRKTNNFYVNLMREIDPTKVQGVTADIWMMRAFGFKNADGSPYSGSPTDAQYTFVEEETKRIADRLGWEPQQVQAAIWVANKAKDDGMSIADAAFDYSDALLNNKAQISWESIPGRTGNHLPEMFDAPYEVQQEYHVAVSKVFLDEDGNDLVAKELGIPTPGDFEAPGYFEGKVSPGTQTELAIPKAGGTKYGEVEPGALDLMHAYAAVRGVVMKQDGVGFHRPFYNATKQDSQGVLIEIGRQFSERETKQLGEIMAELSGHTDYNPIAAPGGVRLINFAFARKNKDGSKAMEDTWFSDDMLRTNADFHALVKQAVERLDLDDDVGVKLGTFNAQEGYVGNDWSVNKNGEDYIGAASSAGSPDLQRKVRSLISKLTARIDEVDRDFSERYGFTRNADINQEYRGQGPVADGPPQEAPDG